jgi:hypothetical protein
MSRLSLVGDLKPQLQIDYHGQQVWELETNGNTLFNRKKNKRISCKKPIFVRNLWTSSKTIEIGNV